jgi:hypothetical protein
MLQNYNINSVQKSLSGPMCEPDHFKNFSVNNENLPESYGLSGILKYIQKRQKREAGAFGAKSRK